MGRRLPSLNAMRAFEVAARHLSFTRAAAELSVTPAAISHQVKSLETRLGAKLFRRLNNGLQLTDAGESYLPGLRDGFKMLDRANARMMASGGRTRLTVRVAPSLATKWLVPRLERFHLAHPELEARIDAWPADVMSEDADLAVCPDPSRRGGLRVDALLGGEVFPVCSPRLPRHAQPLHVPEDLRRHALLHVAAPPGTPSLPGWADWLRAARITGIDSLHGPRFPRTSLALQAAIDGRGVALSSSVLAADDLAARRLVRPFHVTIPAGFIYCVVCPRATAHKPKIAAFRDWIMAEAAAFVAEQQH